MGEETLENRTSLLDMVLIGVRIDQEVVDIHDDSAI